jgi:hypothetical protein
VLWSEIRLRREKRKMGRFVGFLTELEVPMLTLSNPISKSSTLALLFSDSFSLN